MGLVVAHIVNPVEVNRWLLTKEQKAGVQIVRFVLLMERAERWAIDDIQTDEDGTPVAVNDERGTAHERVRGVMRLQQVLNSPEFAVRLADPDHKNLEEIDERLIEVMSMLRTGRFVVCVHHLSTLSPSFINGWLVRVDKKATAGSILAHVLRERLIMLKRANLIRAVFSKEAVNQVLKTLEGIQTT